MGSEMCIRDRYKYPQGGEETRDGDQGKRAQAGGTVSWRIVAAATPNAADAFAAAGTTTSHELAMTSTLSEMLKTVRNMAFQ